MCSLLSDLARYAFRSGKRFEQRQLIRTNGPIRANYDTDIVGLVVLNDPVLEPVDSPHGRVEFIQAFGITQTELNGLVSAEYTAEAIIERHRSTNPLLVTDLSRRDG